MGVGGDSLDYKLEIYFTLLSFLENTVKGSDWYLYSSSSYHMTRNKDFFSSLEEKDFQMHIELRDDGRYNATGIGIVTFNMEFSFHLRIKYVMFVSWLKNKLIYVAVLEDKGYDVFFSKGKAFLKHVATKQVK